MTGWQILSWILSGANLETYKLENAMKNVDMIVRNAEILTMDPDFSVLTLVQLRFRAHLSKQWVKNQT